MEAYLLDQARRQRFPATILHPRHIVGPGWVPLNPNVAQAFVKAIANWSSAVGESFHVVSPAALTLRGKGCGMVWS